MAYSREDELKRKAGRLAVILKSVKVFKYIFFSYAFLAFLFWFLTCFEPDWLYFFNKLFIIPYKLVRLLYKPAGIGPDFTLAIIGVVSLVSGIISEIILTNSQQKMSILMKKLEIINEQKKDSKKKTAKPIPGGSREFPNMREIIIAPELIQEDSIILVCTILIHVYKIKNSADDADLSFEEAEAQRKRVNKKLLDLVKASGTQPMKKGYFRKNLFFVYKEFNYADDFTEYMHPAINSIIEDFQKEGFDVQFSCILSAITLLSVLEKELDLMDTILSLNFVNSFILTNTFNRVYEIKTVKKYEPVLKGKYNLSKNLSISNVQPLYEFKELSAKGN